MGNQKLSKKGKIYKIIALTENFNNDDTYYGSTISKYLCQRWRNHKKDYYKWKLEKTNLTSSFFLFEKYGFENCKIILIKEIEINNIDELRKEENKYILNNKCINKYKSYLSEEDKKIYKKNYIPNHKNDKRIYDIEYRKKNINILKQNNICECGGTYQTKHKSAHLKTKIHINYDKDLKTK